MNQKLDALFKFREDEKFKKFSKIFSVVILVLSLAALILVIYLGGKGKDQSRPYVFALLPLILLASFFRKNDYLFLVAEFLTIIADIFLILLKKIDVGFPIYLLVQLTYAVFFFFKDENRTRQKIITIFRVTLMLIAVVVLAIMKKSSMKLDFGAMYFINIIINAICAIFLKDPVLIVGFSIFMLSDAFIGLSMAKINAVDKFLGAFNFVYFTYIISQCILLFNRLNNNYSKELLK